MPPISFNTPSFIGGRVAVSPDGKTIVWAPMGVVPHYSSNNGSSWTASTGASTAIVNPTSVSYQPFIRLACLFVFPCFCFCFCLFVCCHV